MAGGTGCVMCGAEPEDVSHFLQRCSALVVCRERLGVELRGLLPAAGVPGMHILGEYEAGGAKQLCVLLGGLSLPPCPSSEDKTCFAERCALARWVLDKAVKQFMTACWRLRAALVGDIQVAHGAVVVSPPLLNPDEVRRAQRACAHSPLPDNARHYWREWIIKPRLQQTRRERKKSPFYVVLRGREIGVCDKWADCERSVIGFPGARFRGCQTLAEADALLSAGVD